MSHPYYDAIIAALKDETPSETGGDTAASLVDDRIHGDQLPADPRMPSIRVVAITDLPHQRLSGGKNTNATVQVDIYAHRNDSATAWEIDRLVRRVLDRASLDVSGFVGTQIACMQRGRPFQEPPFYRITSQYRLWASAG